MYELYNSDSHSTVISYGILVELNLRECVSVWSESRKA